MAAYQYARVTITSGLTDYSYIQRIDKLREAMDGEFDDIEGVCRGGEHLQVDIQPIKMTDKQYAALKEFEGP